MIWIIIATALYLLGASMAWIIASGDDGWLKGLEDVVLIIFWPFAVIFVWLDVLRGKK